MATVRRLIVVLADSIREHTYIEDWSEGTLGYQMSALRLAWADFLDALAGRKS